MAAYAVACASLGKVRALLHASGIERNFLRGLEGSQRQRRSPIRPLLLPIEAQVQSNMLLVDFPAADRTSVVRERTATILSDDESVRTTCVLTTSK